MLQIMKSYWWLVLLRGIVAVLFGVFTLFNPGITAVTLVLYFGIYAIVSGVVNLGMAIFGGGESSDRAMLAIGGILGAGGGVRGFSWPGNPMITLLAAIIPLSLGHAIV